MVIRKHGIRIVTCFFFLLLSFSLAGSSNAIELDPYPVDEFSRDQTSIYLFREERPSFYWLNIGLPDDFLFGNKSSLEYSGLPLFSFRSIEYGLRACRWMTDQWQLRLTFPLEAIVIEDSAGKAHNATRIGDVEVGTTFLFLGERKKGSFIGADGWFRVPTGSNPFQQAFPLLSTGKGASRETIGIVSGQQVGGFSFFQSIHYETTQSLVIDSSNPFLPGTGIFQWPDNFHALGRIEWLAFQRAQRFVSLYYQLRMRISGPMKLNGSEITYGWGQISDLLFFSTGGLKVSVDKDFSVGGQVSTFPEFSSEPRPEYGLLFSLMLVFKPI